MIRWYKQLRNKNLQKEKNMSLCNILNDKITTFTMLIKAREKAFLPGYNSFETGITGFSRK